MSQLPADCLNEVFECLEEDKVTLRSCLLVNRLWCEVSVRILWRSIRNYNTLIACLPNESKEILYKSGITISTSISNPPTFNYSSFCKVLSVSNVKKEIGWFLKKQSASPQLLNIVIQEIFKLLMNQISLKKLEFCMLQRQYLRHYGPLNVPNFTSFPGARDGLKNLTELSCYSSIYPEFFYQLSKICHNIESLSINFDEVISNGLADLISVQQNLKCLYIVKEDLREDLTADIITSLTNLPDTLIKIELYGDHGEDCIPLLFITKQVNLQEMTLSFDFISDFEKLQHTTFSHLQVLKFIYESPSIELLIKFLEINGRNLKEFYVNYNNMGNLLNLVIAKFCPNLRKLFTGFNDNELETLKIIFDSCQYLESIKIWCCDDYLNEKVLFDVLITHSPKNFYELKLCYSYESKSDLLPDELESFFTSWAERIPQKSFSLIIIHNDSDSLDQFDENMEIIKKFIRLGVIKEFKTIGYYCESD